MEYDKNKKEIKLGRISNNLDSFVLKFCRLLDFYVIVSGYVAILFGRSRATEDIDLLVPSMSFNEFSELWNKILNEGFECLNTSKVSEAYDYLRGSAIRFSLIGKPIPNVEFKIIKNDLDRYSFNNKIKVLLDEGSVFISPFEMHIAYKLFLGSEKDLEDAKHIYELFKEDLNIKELNSLLETLKVKNKFEEIK